MPLSLEGFCMFVLCPSQSEQTDCRYRRNTLHCTWRWRELRCAHDFSGQHWMDLMFFSFSSHLFRFLFPQIHGEWRCLAVCEVPEMALECVCFSFLGQMALGIRIAMSIFFFKTSLRFLFRKKKIVARRVELDVFHVIEVHMIVYEYLRMRLISDNQQYSYK